MWPCGSLRGSSFVVARCGGVWPHDALQTVLTSSHLQIEMSWAHISAFYRIRRAWPHGAYIYMHTSMICPHVSPTHSLWIAAFSFVSFILTASGVTRNGAWELPEKIIEEKQQKKLRPRHQHKSPRGVHHHHIINSLSRLVCFTAVSTMATQSVACFVKKAARPKTHRNLSHRKLLNTQKTWNACQIIILLPSPQSAPPKIWNIFAHSSFRLKVWGAHSINICV